MVTRIMICPVKNINVKMNIQFFRTIVPRNAEGHELKNKSNSFDLLLGTLFLLSKPDQTKITTYR